MDYAEVQRYSRVYDRQNLYAEQQRRAVDHMSAAIAIVSWGSDPTVAPPADFERFRQEVLALRSALFIEEQLAQHLSEAYGKALNR